MYIHIYIYIYLITLPGLLNFPFSIYLFEDKLNTTRTICKNPFKVNNKGSRTMSNDLSDFVLVSFLLTLGRFHTFFACFHCDFENVNSCWLST